MHVLPEIYRALEAYADGNGPRPALDELGRLSGPGLVQSDEHAVARTLLLAALCGRLDGNGSVADGLLNVARTYEENSFLHTGRIMPRFKELIGLLDRAVDDRDPRTLVEVADHLSQGWSAYPASVFPAALARLAAELGFAGGEEPFTTSSFSVWCEALDTAADDRAEQAEPLFRDSLARYRAYRYHADAAWLFTDIVIVQLTLGRDDEAAATVEEQRQYITEVLARYPVAEDGEPVFQLGDVQSGVYSTFVESVTLWPKALAEQDRTILQRYLRTSELLLSACKYRARRDFVAALDLFSFGWMSFPASPYPYIFQLLARRLGSLSRDWNAQLTAYAGWHRMLRASPVGPTSQHLIGAALDLHDRLGHSGLGRQGDIALLDAAIIHARLHGRAATVEWIGRYTKQLRSKVPDLLRAAVDCLQSGGDEPAPADEAARRALAHYMGLRSRYAVPAPILERPLAKLPDQPVHVEVALYGRLLSIEGITVYEQTPDPLTDILDVLGEEFTRCRTEGRDVPLLSAAELSARTGRTSAALAQSVRRFRGVAQERFRQATTFTFDPSTVIQGRPGYRINPAAVESFLRYPAAR
ncbi:hypothetical protein ABT093_25125 [Kitasatospora sp. NPDC002551]|uniref:hypothetical protein n=1 Tax=unclassified Kitasatospora TaxID=2633591 RepID=UPI003317BEBD